MPGVRQSHGATMAMCLVRKQHTESLLDFSVDFCIDRVAPGGEKKLDKKGQEGK